MKFNRRLVIMITDLNGSRHINVDVMFKRAAAYLLAFAITAIVFVSVGIFVVNQEMRETKNRNLQLTSKFMEMQEHNDRLNAMINQKNEEIALVGDRFVGIEDLLETGGDDALLDSDGLGDIEDIPTELDSLASNLIRRIDTASLTTLQRSFIMKFIPNGSPLNIPMKISGKYGRRYHPILNVYHIHTGIDIAAPFNTPVYATADGVVDWASAGDNGGYGKLIKISHSFGFRTYYAHLNDIKAQRGQFVKKGQLIALTGSSGRSTGPHLHYEIRFLGQPINPLNFVEWSMQNFSSIFEKEKTVFS